MCNVVHEMLQFLIKGGAGTPVTIEPTDREGLWLQSATGLTGNQLRASLEQPVSSLQWQVTSVKDARLLVEPNIQTRFDPQWAYMFHVSDKSNRQSISRN